MKAYNQPKPALLLSAAAIILLISAFMLRAGEPELWETGTRTEVLKGDAHGVSISDTGLISLAPKLTQLFDTTQAYVWSAVTDGAGNVYLGTGHDGRIYRVGPDGKGSVFYDATELDVTALVVAKDGSLYAASSPDGKVYHVSPDGKAETYFEPHEKYIWSMVLLSDGTLVVGTGDKGKLFRVKTAGAKPEASLFFATNETHVISLAVDAQDNVLAGTDPSGLVLRITPEGKAFALLDAPLREIHALAPAPDGSIYVLALGESALANAKAPGPGGPPDATGQTGAGGAQVTSADESSAVGAAQQGQPTARSRNDFSNSRSAVFRILPDGGVDVVWNSAAVTAFSIAPQRLGGVLIGTSDKGRIYAATNDGRDTLLLQSGEGQISLLFTRGADVFACSSNQGKLFRFGAELAAEGTYESSVHDVRFVAAWGRIWWRAAGPVVVQTRAGNTDRPDATWSEWSAIYSDQTGAQILSPRARFVQWRATLRAATAPSGVSASIEDVSLAYLPRNIAPEVLAISVLPTGVGLQALIQAPADPNLESSGLDPALFGQSMALQPRRVYQRGARALQWSAEDRNNDALEFAVYYRALNESGFHMLKDKLRDSYYTIDGAALADGRYIFKVVATDGPENPNDTALAGERLTEPVDLDNSPPVLRVVEQPVYSAGHVKLTFDASDASRLKHADVSVDGSQWRTVVPADGIADSANERYALDLVVVGTGEHTVSLRAFDVNGNVGSLRLSVK